LEIKKFNFCNLIKEFNRKINYDNYFMDLKSKIVQIKDRFIEIWSENKIFRYAVILHLSYFVISLVLVLTVFREQNDFLIYWKAGGVFLEDTTDLYNQENYIWDFRYFPLSAVFFIPFYILGFDLGFVVFHTMNLIINVLICVLLYNIISLVKGEGHEKDDKRVILYISLYLMSIPQMLNYILGQINLYITFFILLSIYIFLKYDDLKWQFIGSFILGISIIIKPTALFMVPFLIVINLDLKTKKLDFDIFKSVIRLVGVIVPIAMNLVLFFLYPELLDGFIATNFTGSNPLTLNYSFSITKNTLNFFYIFNIPYNQLYVLLVILVPVAGLGFLIFIAGDFSENSIIYGFTFSIMIMLLVYYDSWDHHLLNLTPLLIIIIFNMPRKSENVPNIKRAFFFFSFFDLAFMGMWFLTFTYFPFNFGSTIFLIISFISISLYGLTISRTHSKQNLEGNPNDVE